jgi:demethylmenaquinone methyltransferase/2-methoxy-6-polyprenyl-1,4-benzoquinol methylase
VNEKIRDFFDNLAISYHHDDNKMIEELLNSLSVTKCYRILDLGCGKGIISEKLANRNHGEVIALDISSKMIELAKERINNPHVTFINQDFYEFSNQKFDAIICFDAFPHFMDVEGFVNKASELLDKDGLLAIIHDIGRPALNEHHKRSAGAVSRLLKEPEQEVKPFLNKFTPIELSESDNYYKMVMIKK